MTLSGFGPHQLAMSLFSGAAQTRNAMLHSPKFLFDQGRCLMAKQTCSNDRPEFTATPVRQWLSQEEVKTRFMEPGSPWENCTIESFNVKLGDELLNREIFETRLEAKVLTERWRINYNTIRPHCSRGYWPPAPETVQSESERSMQSKRAGDRIALSASGRVHTLGSCYSANRSNRVTRAARISRREMALLHYVGSRFAFRSLLPNAPSSMLCL
ncbi:MAG: hypothetical protein CMM07_15890 [Rhodopirellula sp.]|nr:hypothetical protein [Rhodopirellula sp.]